MTCENWKESRDVKDSTTRLAGREGSQIGDVVNVWPRNTTLWWRGFLILLCVWVFALIYLGLYLKRGWVPHDEGTFAQSAERVLEGELPHRDFIDNYTGGLTFLNALAFRILGVNLASLRILLFTLFAFWVPCVFYIASRFVSPLTAGTITFLAAAWSVPNYPAGVPSWYNLFFAVFGISALFRFMEGGSSRWLFVAGLCGAFSILIKITGLYFVVAVVFFFIFREQNLECEIKGKLSQSDYVFRALLASGLILFLVLLTRMVYRIHGVSGVVYFAMPSAFLVMLLLGNEFARARGSVKHRFANLLSMFAPFGLGLAIPIVSYLILYSLAHSTGPLFHDLFDGTEKQLLFASTAAPPVLFMIPVFPVALLIAVALASHRQGQVVYGSLLAMYLGGILVLSSRYQLAYAHGWCSLAYAIPVLTLAGAVTIGTSQVADIRKQQIMLLVAAMAVISLVQFPFSAPVYFCYVAPLAILAAVGVFSSLKHQPRLALGALIAFYLTFAVVRVTPGFSLGTFQHSPEVKTEQLTLARAGNLRVDPRDAQVYEKLIPAIKSRARSNFIYAAPDCPEIYFLADLQNPTRTIFDFREDPVGRQSRILRTLENHNVNVITINRQPQFSGTLEPDLLEALRTLYPDSEEIGHFQVRWKTVQPAQTKRND